MTIALWCVLAAGLLPLGFVGYAKLAGRSASGDAYDNNAPRAFLEAVEGKAQRAHWAEQNGYEAFPLFAAGVLTAQHLGAAQGSIDMLAMIFVAARVAHGFCYIADLAPMRSLVWAFGFAASIGLFVLAA